MPVTQPGAWAQFGGCARAETCETLGPGVNRVMDDETFKRGLIVLGTLALIAVAVVGYFAWDVGQDPFA
jgi:hypothetical protein